MIINSLIRLKKGMVKLLELSVIILFAVLVADVLWGVLSRAIGVLAARLIAKGYAPWSFLPTGQTQWNEEVAIYLMMGVSLGGGGVGDGA